MTQPAVVDGVDIDAVSSAVRSCAAVDDLYSDSLSSVASYLPGRQVAGIRVAADAVTIQIRSRWGVPVSTVATQVRSAVVPLIAGRVVDVVIADITDSPSTITPARPAAHTTPVVSAAKVTPLAPAEAVLDLPVDVSGEQPEKDPIAWTNSSGDAAVNSSSPTTPTGVAIPPLSSPV